MSSADSPIDSLARTIGRVDAHHHLWDPAVFPQSWIGASERELDRAFSMDDLRPHAQTAGVTATVAVQSIHSVGQTTQLLELAAADPLLAGVVGWADLEAPGLAAQLATWSALPGGAHLVGIRHLVQSESDTTWLDRPRVRDGLLAISDAGIAFDLVIKPPHLPAAARLVYDMPQLTFVLDHLGKPHYSGDLASWGSQIRELAGAPNVYCKISGLVSEVDWARSSPAELQPAVDIVRDAFGPERLIFGSDWPVCLLAASYGEVVEVATTLMTGSTGAELEAFFGHNARRAYGLRSYDDVASPAS